MVQTAETLVAQMDAEISEDQQAVRQLLHNITEFLGQIKTLQSSLNTSKGENMVLLKLLSIFLSYPYRVIN